MKSTKRSSATTLKTPEVQPTEEEEETIIPTDTLIVNVFNLRLYEDDDRHYLVRISFGNREILTDFLLPINKKAVGSIRPVATGCMEYYPGDYEEMCKFANYPLIVTIQPYKRKADNPHETDSINENNYEEATIEHEESSCNIDILPLFIDQSELIIHQNLEPMQRPSVLQSKSWNLLPLIELQITVSRNSLNAAHHEILEDANFMQISLIGAFNLFVPYNSDLTYTAATKMPIKREPTDNIDDAETDLHTNIITFSSGRRLQRRFELSYPYPKWESLRSSGYLFTKCDEKIIFNTDALQNDDDIDYKHYFKLSQSYYTTLWRSFHRYLIIGDSSCWLTNQLCQYKWPFELHMSSEHGGYSFMAFLDLFQLLYPGESTMNLVVPLHWVNAEEMRNACGCDLLLPPNEAPPHSISETVVSKKSGTKQSELPSLSDNEEIVKKTGFDDGSAFVLIQIRLAKPLKKIVIPTPITQSDIDELYKACLHRLDKPEYTKFKPTGRGHSEKMWIQTIQSAEESLRNVPFYGKVEFCSFNRQLSETRTRVEIFSSFIQDAAIYTNNNFVVGDFLKSNEAYEELIRMAHACLIKLTARVMLNYEDTSAMNPVLKAARHARQLQDIDHAKTLYLQVVTENPRNADYWRELAICYRDIDKDYATVCIDKSILLNPRHPLTLLTKAGMVFEEDPDAADVFFVCILCLEPFWGTGWVIANAYYTHRQMYYVAEEIMKYYLLTMRTEFPCTPVDPGQPRAFESELGDWWDSTPLLPGQSPFYDAADLLLRLRAMALAEVCLAKAVCEEGETPQYVHLVALCCRLRGQLDDALCHLDAGIKAFGVQSYLLALDTECRHQKKDCAAALSELDKAGTGMAPYTTLMAIAAKEPQKVRPMLVDLIRKHPSAYAWMALADDWIKRASSGEGGDAGVTEEQTSARNSAAACAVQALKLDRRAARAWALLAKLCKPRARRLHCRNMAIANGYKPKEHVNPKSSEQSLCHYLGDVLKECQCVKYLQMNNIN